MVGKPGCARGNVIGQAHVSATFRLGFLLPQEKQASEFYAGLVGVEYHNVIAFCNGRKQADYRRCPYPVFLNDPGQHRTCILIKAGGNLAYDRVFKDAWITANQLPGLEKRCPVY